MRKSNGIRFLSFVVSIYLVAALVWWSILLLRSNSENLELKNTLEFSNSQIVKNNAAYSKTKKMIIGEGVVFGISLLVGIFLIERAYRKELEASQQQNNFILAITHELKTPLTAMKMGLQTLQRHKLDEGTTKELIEDSIHEGDRLENLINSLLLANKLDRQYEIHKTHVDFSNYINDFLAGHYQGKLEKIEVNIYPQDLSIDMDPNAMDMVLSNLIENGFKYSPDGKVSINATLEEGKCIIRISDNGPGIPKKFRKQVFQKFFRIGNEETRRTKGTGLGLYIVKQIIEKHDGDVSIEEGKPKGCTIKIILPQDR